MQSSILVRLQGWRDVAIHGSPAWLAEVAPKIIRQLEAEIAADAKKEAQHDRD